MKSFASTSKFVLLLLPLFLISCGSLMATFDQTSYSQVTSLKVDAIALINKSKEPYSTHLTDVSALQLELDKAVEYDKHRPKNEITNEMWTLMSNPNGHLLGGFLTKWKKDKQIDSVEIVNIDTIVARNFDRIAELEIKKLKS
jgi:hypothetical protein